MAVHGSSRIEEYVCDRPSIQIIIRVLISVVRAASSMPARRALRVDAQPGRSNRAAESQAIGIHKDPGICVHIYIFS